MDTTNIASYGLFFSSSVFLYPWKKGITDRRGETSVAFIVCCPKPPPKTPQCLFFKQHCTKKQLCIFQEYDDIYHCSICNRKDNISQGNVSCIQHDLALVVRAEVLNRPTGCCPCLKRDSDPWRSATTWHDTPCNRTFHFMEGHICKKELQTPPPQPRRNRHCSLAGFF